MNRPGSAAINEASSSASDSVLGQKIRFPALDGCRALAALGVLITHVSLLSGFSNRSAVLGPYLARMDVGVSVFFVLSGFLLYRPFVAARFAGESTGDVGAYARRRVLRILPAYWVALTVVGFVLKAPGFVEPHSIVTHYLLLQIYDSSQLVGGPIQQAWSLATEVAFYVFVPCWAWLLSRRRRSASKQLRVEVGALIVIFVASAAANLGLIKIGVAESTFAQLGTWLPFRIGDFVPGMLLAVASAWVSHNKTRLPAWLRQTPAALGFWLCALGVFWFVSTQLDLPMFPIFTPAQAYLVRVLYLLFATLLVIPAVLARSNRGLVTATAANPVAIWLGLVSYGIYIWHEAWQDIYLRLTDQQGLNANFLQMLLFTLALTMLSATISWYVVEKPAIRWGARLRGGSGPSSVAHPPAESAPRLP
ncbi:MAG: acyltransferase [Actinomycetes bacterium]